MKPEIGYCECGCGQKTKLAKQTLKSKGWRKGKPLRFLMGHSGGRPGAAGAGQGKGYRYVKAEGHPRSNGTHVKEHIVVAEASLGRALPPGAVVHHVNQDRGDNRPENLVVCENNSYHRVLHRRMRAMDECGNANWRKCHRCKVYDEPARMVRHDKDNLVHQACRKRYQNKWRATRKALKP